MTDTVKIQTLDKYLKIGQLKLRFPDQGMSCEQTRDLYARQYPQLRSAVIDEPQIVQNELIYTAHLAPIKTKG